MYSCKHFAIHELVPERVFKDRGEKAWELLDDRLLITLDQLRDQYGSMTINNYFWGGDREWSGLRTPPSPYFSPYSQHTFGRAADVVFATASVADVRAHILNNPTLYPHIRAVELDVSWLHIDTRNCRAIKAFKP